MSHRRLAVVLITVTLAGCGGNSAPRGAGAFQKPRVVVTADPELDDLNSLIRYLLYSTDFRTEGLIYASSGFHWKGDGTDKKLSVPNREYSRFGLDLCPCASWRWAPNERFIDDAVDAYAKVYANLRVHDPAYPRPEELKSKIRWGNVEFDGDISKATPGSDLIKALLLDDVPGPIYLLAWGGQSTIARALKSIQEQYAGTSEWAAIQQKVSNKAIISASGDQDDTYATYIRPNWPDIESLQSGTGGVALAYGASPGASAENSVYYSADWTRSHISRHGPFGTLYRVWGDGKQMVKDDVFDYFGLSGYTAEQLQAKGYVVWMRPRPQGEFIAEGDTFTYLNLIGNGLAGYQEGTPGGWAGNGVPDTTSLFATLSGRQSNPIRSYADLLRFTDAATARGRPASPDPNFVPAAQNAFAARMKWSVTPRSADANHEPTVTLRGSSRLSARPGRAVRLEAIVSDPDSDAVTVRWWQWKAVGGYPGHVTISNPKSLITSVLVPADATAGQSIHIILEATDNGTPALRRYQRLVLSITR